MFNLLYKELRLAAHPTLFIFMFMGVLLIIPNYPYGVVFFFGSLAPFITFIFNRETQDVYFTVLLPIKKSDAVKGKCLMVVFFQLSLFIISVPFAIMRIFIVPNGNLVGIEPNVAYYGFGFIIFSIFNFIFFTQFYKTAYKAGKSFVIAIIPVVILIVVMETISHIPTLQWLNSVKTSALIRQIPILTVGIISYIVGIIITYFASAKRFARVDL